ncbi:MAG: hypothetical protein KDD47_28710 [Acidobacteria bacterium]|nr:hypothetical protein [Acidobacteriota bacterium]
MKRRISLYALKTLAACAVFALASPAIPALAQSPHGANPHAQQQMPPGHPPVSTPDSPVDALPPVPEGAGTGSAGLEWKVPDSWSSVPPSSSMRRAQYRVPGSGGDGECVVFYFGPGQGGTPMANARRWAEQFTQPDGRASTEVMETEELEVNGVRVLWVQVTGTYGGGMTMGPPKPPQSGSMLLGAIAQGGDANWFFKVTGPESTLRENAEAFRGMIGSLRSGQAGS